MSKKFPSVIHVTYEDAGSNEEPYMQVHEDGVFGAAEVGKSKPVAVYKLLEVGAVVAPPSFVSKKRKP